jgi:hypothetical protein
MGNAEQGTANGRAIINLMPKNVQEILRSYSGCQPRDETHSWTDDVAKKVIALAKVPPEESSRYGRDRAYCPLCGDGSSSPYQRGFSVPEGLRRHLIGWGQTRQCDVTHAAEMLARPYWHEQFHATEVAERTEQQTAVSQRRGTETLYRTAPDLEPKLIDGGLGFLSKPRNKTELVWAEQRLVSLGFQIATEGNEGSDGNGMRSDASAAGGMGLRPKPRPAGGRNR